MALCPQVIPCRHRRLTQGQKHGYSSHQLHTPRTNQDQGLTAQTCVCSWACFHITETTTAGEDLEPEQVSVCCCQDLSANDQAVPCLGLPALF